MNTANTNNNNNEGMVQTTRTTTRIGFGSCHKNKKSASPPIWDVITADRPNIWIWTGDTIYSSSKRDPVTGKKRYGPADPTELKLAFDEMKMNRTIGYYDFLSNSNPRVEIYGTWDDHDYGGNDSGSGIPNREMRQNLFWDFLGYSRDSKRRQGSGGSSGGDGVYHSVDLEDGKIQLILLDTRSFRQDHFIPSLALKIPLGNAIACFTRWLTAGLNLHKFAWLWGMKDCQGNEFLGEDQWKWLEDTLIHSSSSTSYSNEEEEDDKLLSKEFVDEAHFGGFMTKADDDFKAGKGNNRKEFIENLIRESKKKKAEKRKAEEEAEEKTLELDSNWKSLLREMQGK